MIAVFVLCAVCTLLICSKSSPLYPLNDWIDANCFMTVGKSMKYGLVPYRDLYEQKGPVLYMIHCLASFISENTFIGVWIIELVCATMFLYGGYRLMKEYCDDHALFLVPVLAAFTYSSLFFCHGDSAEELVLPILMWIVWNGMVHAHSGSTTTDREFFLAGLSGGIVLWIKYTLLGVFPAWGICAIIPFLKKGDYGAVVKAVVSVIAGVMVASVPVLLYFGLNHALDDLWQVYFIDNLFVYSKDGAGGIWNLIRTVVSGFEPLLYLSRSFIVMMCAGTIYLLFHKRWRELGTYLLLMIMTGIFAFVGGTWFLYYSLIFAVFIPMGLVCAEWLIGKAIKKIKNHTGTVLACEMTLAVVFCYLTSTNTYLLGKPRTDLPQYQFDQIIRKIENPTLLNYGFLDGGFYTVSQIVPTSRYFAQLNIPLQEMKDQQKETVQKQLVDFVVTRSDSAYEMQEFDGYQIVATAQYTFEGSIRHYALYEKKSLLEQEEA